MQKLLTGALWRDQDDSLYLETLEGSRYDLVTPQTIVIAVTREKVHTDNVEEHHYGELVVANCVIQTR